jgi:hypothetical protein
MNVAITLDSAERRDAAWRDEVIGWLNSARLRGKWRIEENLSENDDERLRLYLHVNFRDVLDAHDFVSWCRLRGQRVRLP